LQALGENRLAAIREGLRVGRIIKRPIDGLAEYHVKFILPHAVQG
jgi:hypothetical protein